MTTAVTSSPIYGRYLYLLFDPDDSYYDHGRYVFTTEAHPLPLDLQVLLRLYHGTSR